MEKIKVHLYFYDDVHHIDAFSRNNIEKNFLVLIDSYQKELNFNTKLNIETIKEGGWIEFYQAITSDPVISSLAGAGIYISGIFTKALAGYFQELFTGKISKTKAETKKTEAETEKIRLETEKIKFEKMDPLSFLEIIKDKVESEEEILELFLNYIAENIDQVKFKKLLSNYYKSLKNNNEIMAISFQNLDNLNTPIEDEIYIPRERFLDNIYEDEYIKPDELENQRIEIIAPVLNVSRAKWRGIYNDKPISFELKDDDFEKKVLNKQVSFKKGSTIICDLKIEKKVDNKGEIKDSNHLVFNISNLD